MTTQQFNDITINDIVYYVANTGMVGIFKYKYIGVFKEDISNKDKHVFVSDYFVNIFSIEVGKEKSSLRRSEIFYSESEARQHQRTLREVENSAKEN